MSGGRGEEVFVFPMSFAQQRLWLLDQLEEGNPAYNLAAALELEGPLDEGALERSLAEIVRRHETLRTTFGMENGEPVQLITEEAPLSLTRHDLAGFPGPRGQAERTRRMREEILRPFDLEGGPLMRVALFRQGRQLRTLLIVMHHIISDGWSTGVFSAELGALYNAYSKGRDSPLPELEIQYADYACWQREWMEGEGRIRQLEYWKEQLRGAPPHLDLATDRPRPAHQSFQGGTVPVTLDPGEKEALEALAAQEGATLSMALLAGFFLLLARFGRARDMVVGTPVANRKRRETEGLIGFFVNTLPIRVDLGGDTTFRELLGRIRESSLDAWENQDVPFEQVVEVVGPRRDLSRSPLFQVMFILQNTPGESLSFPGLKVRPVEVEGHTAKFDLTLSLQEGAGGVEGVLEFNAALFDPGTAGSMAASYRSLLVDAARRPHLPVSTLSAVPAQARAWLREEVNDTSLSLPDATVSELFRARAAASPEKVAVVGPDGTLTYGELDVGVQRLARALRREGVEGGVPVGVCLDRSCLIPLALLGIMEAGGAFLPMDPAFPPDRLSIMVEDAAVPVIVCGSAAARGVLSGLDVKLLVMDGHPGGLTEEATVEPALRPSGDDPAYFIFTSGSTGRPKGVEVGHRSLVNFLHSMARRPGFGAPDVLLAVTTISFDISIMEILLPVVMGGRLVVAGRDATRDPEELGRLLAETGATVMQATPATWRMMVAAGWKGTKGLKILSGGEALPGDLARALLERGASVWNMYGPTETTIWSAVHRVGLPCHPSRPQPLGRPIANTCLHVLDEGLQPVPPGAPGELFIGGLGVARGYVGRPDLTEDRFLTNPLSVPLSSRLYRTGDRVRFRANGSLEYLGRTDHQVKLRGFRIELAEIDATLRAHPAVSDAAAILQEGAPGKEGLAAFVVLHPGGAVPVGELADHLRKRLPEYMIPAEIHILDALPLTPNHKVDRRALAGVKVEMVPTPAPTEYPRDSLEREVARAWEEVLGRPPEGMGQSFFQAGGHSLLAVRLVSLLRERTGAGMPLAILFQDPTVEGLAHALRRGVGREEGEGWPSLVLLGGREGKAPLFFVPGAGGDPWYLHGLAGLLGDEVRLFGCRAPGLDEGTAPPADVETLAEHYLRAIRTVQPHGPYLLAGHSFGTRVAYELAQRLLDDAEEVTRLLVLDTVAPVIPSPIRDRDEAHHLADLAGVISQLTGRHLEVPAEELRALPSHQRIPLLLLRLEEGGGLPPRVGSEGLRRLVSVYTSHLGMEYLPRDPRPVPVTLLKAAEQIPWKGRPPDALTRVLAESDWGWGRLAAGMVAVETVPGDHLSMFRSPQVEVLGRTLLGLLAGHGPEPEARHRTHTQGR